MKAVRWTGLSRLSFHKAERILPSLCFLLGMLISLVRPPAGQALLLFGLDRWLQDELWLFLLWNMADVLAVCVFSGSLWGMWLIPTTCVCSGYVRTGLLQTVLARETEHFFGGMVSYFISSFCLLMLAAAGLSLSRGLWKREQRLLSKAFWLILWLCLLGICQTILYLLLR